MFQPLPVFVGLRYSAGPASTAFSSSFITWVSLIKGSALGVAALITVLSVMNGLETELRTRLLSLTAHASLNAAGRPITDLAKPASEQLQGSAGLEGAAPYLDTDAMLSRPPAMSGAIVRGIDPALESRVSSIGDAMREGKLSDLTPQSNRIILGRMLAYQLCKWGGRSSDGHDPWHWHRHWPRHRRIGRRRERCHRASFTGLPCRGHL